jgi:hypothetical protein
LPTLTPGRDEADYLREAERIGPYLTLLRGRPTTRTSTCSTRLIVTSRYRRHPRRRQ